MDIIWAKLTENLLSAIISEFFLFKNFDIIAQKVRFILTTIYLPECTADIVDGSCGWRPASHPSDSLSPWATMKSTAESLVFHRLSCGLKGNE